jgi:hypothetical protein
MSDPASSFSLFDDAIFDIKKYFIIGYFLLVASCRWKKLTKSDGQIDGNRKHLIRRKRRHIEYIFYELGEYNSWRSYRMKIPVFWKLCELLKPKLEHHSEDHAIAILNNKRIPNGPISHSIRVSIALRYLAGGAPLDIALVHGVSHCEIFKCVWHVIDAINNEPQLNINFPELHYEQLLLATIPREKSSWFY